MDGNQVQRDADEFGVHLRAGGWRLGLLVARSVARGTNHGGDRKTDQRRDHDVDPEAKVSAREFARMSNQSADRVLRYLDAWERAATNLVVPAAEKLNPGTDVDLPDEESTPWVNFYSAGKASTDESVKRSTAAIGRNIASDPEFAAKVAQHLAENQPAALANVASDPSVARAIARNDEAREAVEEQAIEHRARFQQDVDLPDPKTIARGIGDAMRKKIGNEEDLAIGALRNAAGAISEAIMCKEQFGVDNAGAEERVLRIIDSLLLTYRSDGGISDDDRTFLESIGVTL